MKDDFIDCLVWATITIFANDGQKGRNTPIISGYRPNHAFIYNGDDDNGKPLYQAVMGQITLLDREILELNTPALVEIRFIINDEMCQKIKKGFCWRIYEGGNWVGVGEIYEVLRVL
ncbi:hypothetical protein [Moraxella oblonga]|uniref:hypothetical protein n=1 Tax=Moraxella oblonga TaxID=200413 RepID=UPI00082FBC66|nr:hypothetical protein [Moraxella oblonga]